MYTLGDCYIQPDTQTKESVHTTNSNKARFDVLNSVAIENGVLLYMAP